MDTAFDAMAEFLSPLSVLVTPDNVYAATTPFWVSSFPAFFFASVLTFYGYSRNHLSESGAISAWIVGFLTTLSGVPFFAILLVFFMSSSIFSKLGLTKHAKDPEKDSRRTMKNVLANGFVPTLIAVIWKAGGTIGTYPVDMNRFPVQSYLFLCFFGAYCAACGDTWASEVGVSDPYSPRLVTTWKKVPKGTNGGMSVLGTTMSLMGGLFIGLVAWISILASTPGAILEDAASQWPLVIIGGIAGLVGSFIDSILGATLQYSCYEADNETEWQDSDDVVVFEEPGPGRRHISGVQLLSNHQVNFCAILLTAALTGAFGFDVFSY